MKNNHFNQIRKQLMSALNLSREDYLSEGSLAQEKEFKSLIKEDGTIDDDIEMECISNLSHICYGAWLFKYKDRGYILWDLSNGHYEYCSKVEDFIMNIMFSNDFEKEIC